MQLIIDEKTCDRCGTCISVCPCDALLLTDVLTVSTKECTGCGTCVAICPVQALSLD
jgi:NAD-dependent dihydropyrimidine dehydrogenase PreA subunit